MRLQIGEMVMFHNYMLLDLAKEKLGWTAERELNDMIRSSWKWEQNLRNESKNGL